MVAFSTPSTSADYLYDGDGLEVGAITSSSTQQFTWGTSLWSLYPV